jgi:ferritin-like metal-binding protein YciE
VKRWPGLEEEKETDEKLTQIAENNINMEAAEEV